MAKKPVPKETLWVNSSAGHPRIVGNLQVTKSREKVYIEGDPAAFRSLAKLLVWIADKDQESIPSQPTGERFHVHLYPTRPEFGIGFGSLTPSSVEAELCRLDAKGTGDLRSVRRRRRKKS